MPRHLWPATFLAFIFISPSIAAEPSLAHLMASPFPTSLVTAPAGGKVAWVANERGRRNIWVAEPPDYKGRPLTSYADDDGQEISDVSWTADAKTILFVRGNEPHHGASLNPRSRIK